MKGNAPIGSDVHSARENKRESRVKPSEAAERIASKPSEETLSDHGEIGALRRERDRARAESRWVDADRIENRLEALAKVTRLDVARGAK